MMDVREFSKKPAEGVVDNNIPTTKQANVSTDLIGPVEDTLEYLRENGITDKDIFSLLDTLITTGTITWTYKLFNKIPITYQMRTTWMNEKLVKALEDEAPKSVALFSEIVAKYNLAGSLVQYGDTKYDVSDTTAYSESMLRVSKMSYPVYSILVKQLALFDKLISVMTSAWAIENFMKPPLEESEQK